MNIKEHMKNTLRNKLERYKFNKDYTYTQNILKEKAGHSAQNIFSFTVLSWIFVLVTLFLQIISLATTYSGSKVYFGGIALPYGLSAPFIFAFSIQITVFSLSNSLRKNFKALTIVTLSFATLCSTYFSYIGIYNYVNSPIDYLEQRYTQIYHNMSDKNRVVVENSKTQMKEYVFDITSKIQKEYTRLLKENEKYSKLSEQTEKVAVSNNIIKPNTNSIAKPNINNYGGNLDKYYEDMAKYNAAISNIIGQAANENSSLDSSIYENRIKTILEGKSLDEFTKEYINIQSNKELLENLILSMSTGVSNENNTDFNKKMSDIQQYCINYINTKAGDSVTFNTILTNLFTAYSDVTSYKIPEDFYDNLNSFITLTEKSDSFMKSLDVIKKEVYYENHGQQLPGEASLNLTDALLLFSKLQSEIEAGAYTLNSISEEGDTIDLSSEEYILENMYVLPIKNLFTKNSSLGMAWFCFIFAALIDGLTLLFALAQKRSSRTLLAKKNRELVKNNEEQLEELVLSSLILQPSGEDSKSTIQICLEHLAKFLTLFEITSIGMENGYSLYCPLERLKEYQIFLSVLCQFNLAKIISKEDYELLEVYPTIDKFKHTLQEQANFDVLDEVAATTCENNSEYYLLVKTKFIIWANQKFAIASSNKELAHIITSILKNIEHTGNQN
ncbi:hypothetical protein [Brassicibacter mesophilus]|uniref:hypothetical protein n=1 Tax=Brassicibacter mesophilus TaxID=745119 RepID=UPI003D22D800